MSERFEVQRTIAAPAAEIFAVLVDPQGLRWFGGEQIDLAPRAVYTLAFFVFWLVASLGAGLAVLLCSRPAQDVDRTAADLRPR